MPRIRKIGTANGPLGTFQDGAVYAAPGDLSVEIAQAWVDGGYAAWLSEPPESAVEVAMAEPSSETTEAPAAAVNPTAPRRRPRR